MPPGCHPQEGFKIVGPVGEAVFRIDTISAMAENTDLTPWALIFHYFEGDDTEEHSGLPLWRVIVTQGRVASRIRCLDRQDILESMASQDPHYGDGTYATFHPDLHHAHNKVKRAHGIHVSSRQYRALFRIRKPEAFRKFSGTGGVTRTVPGEKEWLEAKDHLFLGGNADPRAEYLWTEKFDGADWARLKEGEP